MRYEKKSQPVIPLSRFILRLARSAAIAGGILFGGLGIGVLGYHLTENLPWLDALLNASMILSGMGPLMQPVTIGGKLFAGTYALYSGLAVLVIAGVMFGPVVHRFLHRFHLEAEDDDGK
jgi:hypothetical protein